MVSTVVAHYPNTASGRAQALGHNDRLGEAGTLIESEDTLTLLVPNYGGTEEDAERAFPGATVQYNAIAAPKARKSAGTRGGDAPVFPGPEAEPGVPLLASQRNTGPSTGPTPGGSGTASPNDLSSPNDPETGLSPAMSGAGLAEARADRKALGLDRDDTAADTTPAATAQEPPKATTQTTPQPAESKATEAPKAADTKAKK